ncbi:2Fe-2S ferredoxin [Pacificibacter maritimus]|uniref:2Fe-2S ferredoxin n=1 Tax=Pacificibacter maritimus TaxID=762213 RepID=A0A3N4UNB0_9RHOB|nr:2Fe-2S iron-sulfur cluster-binding protein [Pacificibacter maritimus]RPE72146.1 2Fe-2S ferredoxin [Pacificibacter maritimus]
MVNIRITNTNGTEQSIESKAGMSLMEALRGANIDGIVAECGGSMSCATCHVVVDTDWLTATGEISDMEDDMLDCTATDRDPGSRLSCQIELSEALDGLQISIPDNQF